MTRPFADQEKAESPGQEHGWRVRTQGHELLLLVLPILAVSLGFSACSEDIALDSDLSTLKARIGPYRPFQVRLTIDTGYAPCQVLSTGRGNSEASKLCVDSLPSFSCSPLPRPDSAAFEVLRDLTLKERASPVATPRDRHRRALIRLLWQGDSLQLQKSRDLLELALHEDPNNAGILADLSAIETGLAILDDRPDLLLAAYESAQRALDQDPQNLSALFNSALLLTMLRLPVPARAAWDAYLRQDAESPWSQEARENLRELEYLEPEDASSEQLLWETDGKTGLVALEAYTRRNRQRAREWAERDLMPNEAPPQTDEHVSLREAGLRRAPGHALRDAVIASRSMAA